MREDEREVAEVDTDALVAAFFFVCVACCGPESGRFTFAMNIEV